MTTFFPDDSSTPDTEHFGFTRVGTGEDITKDSSKFGDQDRVMLDALLHALATHTHSGSTALDGPTDAPTLTVDSSGGSLPPATDFYYRVSYVDARGLETAAGPEATVTTPDPADDPSAAPALSPGSSGTLAAGDTSYVYTFQDATGGETLPSPAATLTATANSSIDIDLPSLPADAQAFVIYRSRPGQTDFYQLAITTGTTYHDGGAAEDQTIVAPVENTTAATNAVQIAAPLSFLPPGAVGWRIYRADASGGYDGDSLVHEVVETDSNGNLVLTWTDTDDSLSEGVPSEISSTIGDPAISGGGDGGGPITAADLPAGSVMFADVTTGNYASKPRPTARTDIKVFWTAPDSSHLPANALAGDEVTVLA